MAVTLTVITPRAPWRNRNDCRGATSATPDDGSPSPRAAATPAASYYRYGGTSAARTSASLPIGIPTAAVTSHASPSLGSRIKEFFRSTIRRQVRSPPISSGSRIPGGNASKFRSKSYSPGGAKSKEDKTNKASAQAQIRSLSANSATSQDIQNGNDPVVDEIQNGYTIEKLEDSPRAGARRSLRKQRPPNLTLHPDPEPFEVHIGIQTDLDAEEYGTGYPTTGSTHTGSSSRTRSSSQGDSLCDPWEQSSISTATSSPRLRTSSSTSSRGSYRPDEPGHFHFHSNLPIPHRLRALSSPGHGPSQSQHRDDQRSQSPRTRAHSSGSTPSRAREESSGHRSKSSSNSRLPTRSPRVGAPGALCSPPTSPTLPSDLESTSTHSRNDKHISNFRSRLPKIKSSSPKSPKSPDKSKTSKAFWPLRNKTKKQQVK